MHLPSHTIIRAKPITPRLYLLASTPRGGFNTFRRSLKGHSEPGRLPFHSLVFGGIYTYDRGWCPYSNGHGGEKAGGKSTSGENWALKNAVTAAGTSLQAGNGPSKKGYSYFIQYAENATSLRNGYEPTWVSSIIDSTRRREHRTSKRRGPAESYNTCEQHKSRTIEGRLLTRGSVFLRANRIESGGRRARRRTRGERG